MGCNPTQMVTAKGRSTGTVDRGGEGNAGRDAEVVGEKDEAAVNEVEALGEGSSFTPRSSSVRLDRTHRAWLSRGERRIWIPPSSNSSSGSRKKPSEGLPRWKKLAQRKICSGGGWYEATAKLLERHNDESQFLLDYLCFPLVCLMF